ncbi:MAG: helix-turn-helix domain-containing protein [Acidimicrobiia bacterium]|nr:helix-turn-helix domain-containing protein [Acidimicrobiia bacterium]
MRTSVDTAQFLTVEEAAKILRISRSSAYELANLWERTHGDEGLPAIRLGRTLRVPRRAIEALADVPVRRHSGR